MGQGTDPAIQQGLLNNETYLTNLAGQEFDLSQRVFNLGYPGLATAENYYANIATGDPGAIARATAPAAQQITQATEGAKQNILQNTPSGGTKTLALQQADVSQGAQVGGIAAQSFLQAPQALAGLAGMTIPQSTAMAGTAVSGYGQAGQSISSLGNIEVGEQQVQAQLKGQTMGGIASLAEAGASAYGSYETSAALMALAG